MCNVSTGITRFEHCVDVTSTIKNARALHEMTSERVAGVSCSTAAPCVDCRQLGALALAEVKNCRQIHVRGVQKCRTVARFRLGVSKMLELSSDSRSGCPEV